MLATEVMRGANDNAQQQGAPERGHRRKRDRQRRGHTWRQDGVTEDKRGLKTSPEGSERGDSIAELSAAKTTGIAPETKSLVLQMNCRSICNKVLDF